MQERFEHGRLFPVYQYYSTLGSSIDDVCFEMVSIARANSIVIHCTFNGVKLLAKPDSDPNMMINQYAK